MDKDTPPDIIAGTIVPKTERLRSAEYRAAVKFSGTHLAQTLSSVSSVSPVIEQTPILALEQTFKHLRDSELHVYANDDQAIGPRIGVQNVAEPTLKALANYEKERRSRIGERVWWVLGGVLLAAATAYFTWLAS